MLTKLLVAVLVFIVVLLCLEIADVRDSVGALIAIVCGIIAFLVAPTRINRL